MNKDNQHICFIIAMEGEAKPLINQFKLLLQENIFPSTLPMKLYQNHYRGHKISLVINGRDEKHDIDNIGTQAATLASHLAIYHLNPSLIINAGTAGGFQEKDLEIGDVVVAQGSAWFHDRRIPIPKFKEFGLGGYPLSDQSEMITQLGLKSGVISTGNAFDFTNQDQEIMKDLDVSIKDMEAAAIAWVCELAAMPLIIIKGVTDFIRLNKSGKDQFVDNFKFTMDQLTSACTNLLDYLLDK